MARSSVASGMITALSGDRRFSTSWKFSPYPSCPFSDQSAVFRVCHWWVLQCSFIFSCLSSSHWNLVGSILFLIFLFSSIAFRVSLLVFLLLLSMYSLATCFLLVTTVVPLCLSDILCKIWNRFLKSLIMAAFTVLSQSLSVKSRLASDFFYLILMSAVTRWWPLSTSALYFWITEFNL